MIPWWVSVESEFITVASWPPPGEPVETNMPANLPVNAPCIHSCPVASQKACPGRDQISCYNTKDETHLPLGREITVTGRNTKQVGIEIGQLVNRNDGVGRFGRGMHFCQDLSREGLWDSRSRWEMDGESIVRAGARDGRTGRSGQTPQQRQCLS